MHTLTLLYAKLRAMWQLSLFSLALGIEPLGPGLCQAGAQPLSHVLNTPGLIFPLLFFLIFETRNQEITKLPKLILNSVCSKEGTLD